MSELFAKSLLDRASLIEISYSFLSRIFVRENGKRNEFGLIYFSIEE